MTFLQFGVYLYTLFFFKKLKWHSLCRVWNFDTFWKNHSWEYISNWTQSCMITYTHWTTPSSVTIIINTINHNIKSSTMLTIKTFMTVAFYLLVTSKNHIQYFNSWMLYDAWSSYQMKGMILSLQKPLEQRDMHVTHSFRVITSFSI